MCMLFEACFKYMSYSYWHLFMPVLRLGVGLDMCLCELFTLTTLVKLRL